MDLIIKILQLRIVKLFLFLLTIAFILSIYFCRQWYSVQYHKALGFYYVHKADKEYKKMEYQKAINLYKAALLNYPGHSRASCNLGNIYVSFENYAEAVYYYENALKYSPDFIVCRLNLGIILAEKTADYDRAVNEYELAAASKPFIINIPFVYSNTDAVKQNKGISYYNEGLAYRSKSLFAADNSGLYKKELGRAKEAYINAEKFLKNNYDNTYNLALTAHLTGDYKLAAEKYCEAVNLKPDSFDAHYNFALLLRKTGEDKEALEEMEKAFFLAGYSDRKDKNIHLLSVINELKGRIINKGNIDYIKEHASVISLGADDIIYSKGKITADKQKDININKLMKCTYGKKSKDDKQHEKH